MVHCHKGFLPDTGFDKIVLHERLAFIFAGDSAVISCWKDWLSSSPRTASLPEVQGICVSIVDTNSKSVKFSKGQDIEVGSAFFAGSGAQPAYRCWDTNKCARTAVASAKRVDPHSGGEVKYLVFSNGESNITNNASLKDIGEQLAERGMIMYWANGVGCTPSAVPVQEAAANDVAVKDLLDRVAAGTVSASAPCDAMYNTWTDADKAELSRVLQELMLFGEK